MNETIDKIENEIIEEFSFFDDWLDKYQYIIEQGQKLNGSFPEEKHNDEYKIKGCQSNLWLTADLENDRVVFKADSDSSIVKGLVFLMMRVFSGQKPDDILNAKLDFLDKIGLKQHLAQTRQNGLAAMIKQMRMYALAYKLKLHDQKINLN
jgi:cysteine desulfuration protein SufE